MEVSETLIVTEAVVIGVTVITMGAELAGEPVTQPAFEVITQTMVSLFIRLALLNKELSMPALTPLIFHW